MFYTFGGTFGFFPYGVLLKGGPGTFYGTTAAGGLFGKGTVLEFTLRTSPSGHYTYRLLYSFGIVPGEIILHSFTGGADGACPAGPPVMDSGGNLYGGTPYGGIGTNTTACYGGNGTIFKLTRE